MRPSVFAACPTCMHAHAHVRPAMQIQPQIVRPPYAGPVWVRDLGDWTGMRKLASIRPFVHPRTPVAAGAKVCLGGVTGRLWGAHAGPPTSQRASLAPVTMRLATFHLAPSAVRSLLASPASRVSIQRSAFAQYAFSLAHSHTWSPARASENANSCTSPGLRSSCFCLQDTFPLFPNVSFSALPPRYRRLCRDGSALSRTVQSHDPCRVTLCSLLRSVTLQSPVNHFAQYSNVLNYAHVMCRQHLNLAIYRRSYYVTSTYDHSYSDITNYDAELSYPLIFS